MAGANGSFAPAKWPPREEKATEVLAIRPGMTGLLRPQVGLLRDPLHLRALLLEICGE